MSIRTSNSSAATVGERSGSSTQAVSEAGLPHSCSTDITALASNNVLAGIEVQVHPNNMSQKISNWSKLLAYSPMQRRGLICIWLLIRDTSQWQYPALGSIIETASHADEMLVGDPSVASRMGIRVWDDWFDEQGNPTGGIGTYRGHAERERSMFSPDWSRCTPSTKPVTTIRDWGWTVMDETIRHQWGWDVSGWRKRKHTGGGFYGYIGGESVELSS